MRALQLVQKFYPNVTDVVDASKPLEVEIIQADIQSSNRKNHRGCVVAKACKRNGNDGVVIAIKTAYLIKGNKATRYKIPESLTREIVAFDRLGAFELGDYHLDRPAPSFRLKPPGKPRVDTRRGRPHGSLNQVNYHSTKSIRNINEPLE